MSYGDFTLKEVQHRFQLQLAEPLDWFAEAPELEPSPLLRANLQENIPLATAINTEKARSELIIAPVLVEVRARLEHRISLFSGVDFTVDPEKGLNGVCDFLLSKSPVQQFIDVPVVTVFEAKNENLKSGLGQCAAAMVAAQLFNEREGKALAALFGCITTGTLWRFLQLAGGTLTIDQREYHIERVPKILGILVRMVSA